MKTIVAILLITGMVSLSSCKKDNDIPAVTGSINGISAITLYGTTNEPVDYILLVTSTNPKELSYGGQVYQYFNSLMNGIYIVTSPSTGVAGFMDTVNGKTVITLTVPINPFASSEYSTR